MGTENQEDNPVMRAQEVRKLLKIGKNTLYSWCEEWLKTYATMHLKPNVKDNYKQMLRSHLIPYLGAKPLSALTAVDLDARYAGMVTDGRLPTTANLLHRIVHRVLKVAVKQGKISHNVAEDADPPKKTRPIMTVWNERELVIFTMAAREDNTDEYLYPIDVERYRSEGRRGTRLPIS